MEPTRRKSSNFDVLEVVHDLHLAVEREGLTFLDENQNLFHMIGLSFAVLIYT